LDTDYRLLITDYRQLITGAVAGHLLMAQAVQGTFTHKFLMMMFAGLAAACLFWAFRHIIQEAFYETSNEGWRDSLKGGTAEKHHR